jgi:hypothetical protein
MPVYSSLSTLSILDVCVVRRCMHVRACMCACVRAYVFSDFVVLAGVMGVLSFFCGTVFLKTGTNLPHVSPPSLNVVIVWWSIVPILLLIIFRRMK